MLSQLEKCLIHYWILDLRLQVIRGSLLLHLFFLSSYCNSARTEGRRRTWLTVFKNHLTCLIDHRNGDKMKSFLTKNVLFAIFFLTWKTSSVFGQKSRRIGVRIIRLLWKPFSPTVKGSFCHKFLPMGHVLKWTWKKIRRRWCSLLGRRQGVSRRPAGDIWYLLPSSSSSFLFFLPSPCFWGSTFTKVWQESFDSWARESR